MKIKICGIQTTAAFQACLEASVDYVGLNFVPSSKRCIKKPSPGLASNPDLKKVGVFQNQSTEFILKKVIDYRLDIIQLHGKERVEQVIELRRVRPVWKALAVHKNLKPASLQLYGKNCDLVLLDGEKAGSGNQISDQDGLFDAYSELRTMGVLVGLAGGLKAQIIPEIIKKFPDLYLIDLASGVETNGQFDPQKLRQIMKLL